MDPREGINEINGDVVPHLGRHIQGLQETGRLCHVCFVVLAHTTRADVVLHNLAVIGDVEVIAQLHEGLLDALMPMVCTRVTI